MGIVAAVLLAACMGGFVWLQKRRKGHSSASDTSSQPMNKVQAVQQECHSWWHHACFKACKAHEDVLTWKQETLP